MKIKRLLLALSAITLTTGSLYLNDDNNSSINVNNNENDIPSFNIKYANATFNYTFSSDWWQKLLSLKSVTSYNPFTTIDSDTKYVNVTEINELDFYGCNIKIENYWTINNYSTYYFDSIDSGGVLGTIGYVLVTTQKSSTVWNSSSNKRVSFWISSLYDIKIIPLTTSYFSYATNCTKYVFDNFKFSSRSQYETIMASSKGTNISGNDVPEEEKKSYTLSDLKEALDEASNSSDFYKGVTSIKYSSSSSDIDNFTNTGIEVDGCIIYLNGNEVVIYSPSKITAPSDMSGMFKDYSALKYISFDNLDTSKTTNFSNLFSGCTSLEEVDLSGLDMSSATSADGFFDSNSNKINKIVTPKAIATNLSITLPNTYYDSNTKTRITSITSDYTSNELILDIHSSSTLIKHDAKASTCNEQGWNEYYTCDICGKIYSDGNGSSEIDSIPYIDKLEHSIKVNSISMASDYNSAELNLICTNDNKDLGIVKSDSVTLSSNVDSTCTTKGSKTYTVSYTFENKQYTYTYVEEQPLLDHNIDFIPHLNIDKESAYIDVVCTNENNKVLDTISSDNVTLKSEITTSPTCTTEGIKTYTYSFSYNGKDYTRTTTENIEALGHIYDYKIKSIDKENLTASIDVICTRENNLVIETLTNLKVDKTTINPTCTINGENKYNVTFTHNGEIHTLSKTDTISALGHSVYFEASSNEDFTLFSVSVKCHNDENEILETISNDDIKVTSEIKAQPTCTETGIKTYTLSFTYNGKNESITLDQTIPATGHDIDYVINLSEDKKSATVNIICKTENKVLETITKDVSVSSSVDTNPTCTNIGKTKYNVTFKYNGETITRDVTLEDIDALGHDIIFKPTLDSTNKTASISVWCNRENKEIATISNENITISEGVITKEPTYTEEGEITYTLTFTYEGKSQSIEVKEKLPVKEDTYIYEGYLNDDGSGYFVVTYASGKTEKVGATVSSKVLKEPTCEENGEIVYTLTASYNGENITKEITKSIPAKGHDYNYEINIIDESTARVVISCKSEDNKIIETIDNVSITSTTDSEGNISYFITIPGYDNFGTIDVTDKVNSYINDQKGDDTSSNSDSNNSSSNSDESNNDSKNNSNKYIIWSLYIVLPILLILIILLVIFSKKDKDDEDDGNDSNSNKPYSDKLIKIKKDKK